MSGQVLVVDDDPAMGRLLASGLAPVGVTTTSCTSVADALARFDAGSFDVVITDVRMGGGGGIALCARVVEARPDVPVIVMTAFGSMDTAIDAIRAGAYDFVTKPFELDRIRITVQRALAHRALHRRVYRLEEALQGAQRLGALIGKSRAMQTVYDLIARVADSDTTVLITGESGTGKELVARALHERSGRAAGPFIAINCAAMPASLLEAELFGHVKGAFTDARADRAGMFQAARGGTLFLDEVGELPLELQPKLLRALQEKRVRPLGSNAEVTIDARILAATNRDLERATQAGSFREDLYYRLQVIDIAVPPLRSRGNDILVLAQHFLERFAATANRPVTHITAPAAAKLTAYAWPGNVRELENCIERAVTLTRFSEITVDDLPTRIREHEPATLWPDDVESFVSMEEVERRYVLRVYEGVGGNKSLAAKVLGFDRKTLTRKLVRYGVLTPSREGSDPA